MNKSIFIKTGEYDINYLKNTFDNYISQYNLNKKYNKYINDNFQNKINIEEFEEYKKIDNDVDDKLYDWLDCDDILAFNQAYNEVMYIKNNCKIIERIYNFIYSKKIMKYNDYKFIKKQCKTKQEYLFYKYYEELLSTELY